MRGFPPIQIFLLCLVFGVLAVPLSHLTGETSKAKAVESAPATTPRVEALLRVRFAHRPATLSLKIGEENVIAEVGDSPMEVEVSLSAPDHGVDVFLAATWPDDTPDTAITLEIEPDGLESRSETRWSSAGSLDEVITFIWK
ncbi:MAG: hypothetical protein R3F13_11545 [Prosthecobacter sp.]